MPSKKRDTGVVSVVHGICCGLDVHKKTVSACLVWSDARGTEECEVMEFETFTDDLVRLKEWLIERERPVVAMESAGPYWTPVHNILEGFFQVILVNARRMRNVPGRKTDLSDGRWLAGLLRHGLLKAAFIPPKYQRQWRDLTRTRTRRRQTIGDFKRRVHKLFQEANIKIDSVLSDLFGLTGSMKYRESAMYPRPLSWRRSAPPLRRSPTLTLWPPGADCVRETTKAGGRDSAEKAE